MHGDSPTRLNGKEVASLPLSLSLEGSITQPPLPPALSLRELHVLIYARLPLLRLLCAISGNHANEGNEEKKGYKRGIRFVNGKRSISLESTALIGVEML